MKPFPAYEWLWMRVKESLVIKGVITIIIFKITPPPLHWKFFFLKEILMKNSHHWNQKGCFYHCNYNSINYAVYYYIKCRGFLLQVNTIKWNVNEHVKNQLFIFQKDSSKRTHFRFSLKKNPRGFENNLKILIYTEFSGTLLLYKMMHNSACI